MSDSTAIAIIRRAMRIEVSSRDDAYQRAKLSRLPEEELDDYRDDYELGIEAQTYLENLHQVKEAERKYEEAMRGLESLTPSGSEFVDDVKRCVQYVRDRQHSQYEAIITFKKAKDAAEERAVRLQERVDELDELSRRALDMVVNGAGNEFWDEWRTNAERVLESTR